MATTPALDEFQTRITSGTRQHPARGHRVPCTTASLCACWPLPPIAARTSGLNLTPYSPPPPPPHLPAYTGLDGGVPTAGDLNGISTFDPNEGTQPRGSGATPSTPTAPSTHIGEGLPPDPAKLVARDTTPRVRGDARAPPRVLARSEGRWKNHRQGQGQKEGAVWLQCFAVYVGVLGPRFPAEVPELMAYMISIVRASQEYEGSAWAAYDTAYRRQAAAQGRTGWSQINPSLYAICFTGKAKKSDRCDRCLSATHRADDCSLEAEDDPDVTKRLNAIESAVVALTRPTAGGKPREHRERSSETCRNWNRNRCSFPGCQYAHLCTSCRGNHPALECPTRSSNATPVGPHCRATCGPRADPPY